MLAGNNYMYCWPPLKNKGQYPIVGDHTGCVRVQMSDIQGETQIKSARISDQCGHNHNTGRCQKLKKYRKIKIFCQRFRKMQ